MSDSTQLSAMVENLFPTWVTCAAGPIDGCPLSSCTIERRQIGRAGDRRKAEFFAGRHYARLALQQAGADVASLPMDEAGAPQWPPGFTGSISHTADCCAAVAARSEGIGGIGLDLERLGRISRPLWRRLFTQEELVILEGLDPAGLDLASTWLFCAKEAFYKAQYPTTGLRLGFLDVTVHLDPLSQSFTVSCNKLGIVKLAAFRVRGRLGNIGCYASAGVILSTNRD